MDTSEFIISSFQNSVLTNTACSQETMSGMHAIFNTSPDTRVMTMTPPPQKPEVKTFKKLSATTHCLQKVSLVFSNGARHHSKVLVGLGIMGFLLLFVQLNLSNFSEQATLRYQRDAKMSKIINLVSKDFKGVYKTMPRELRSMFNFDNYSDVPREPPFVLTEEKIISDLLSAEHPEEEALQKAMLKKKGFDLLPPLPFNQDWTNPCWTSSTGNLQCLPYFYIIGFPRCGVQDIHTRIGTHPLIVSAATQRPNWWTKGRAKIPMNNQSYIYGSAVKAMGVKDRMQILGHADGTAILQVGDIVLAGPKASVQIRKAPAAPRLMTPYLMNKFNRGTKFIVILRNPTDGLFSEYLNHGDKTKSTDILSEKSAQLFHYHTLQVIGMYEDCFKKQNIRACIYDTLLAEEARKAQVPIAEWLFPVYIGDWLQVFPREQFFFVKMEEYSKNTSHVLQEIFSFLGVGPLESSVVDAVAKAPAINSSNQTKSEMEPMFPETRAKLDEFFSPFRKTLANMLDHPKYSWAEEEMRGAK